MIARMSRNVYRATVILLLVLPLCVKAVGIAQERRLTANAELPWVTSKVTAPQIEYRIFDSNAASSKVSYHIYKPSAYDSEPSKRFPVLYWLHGTAGGVKGIRPVAEYFHSAIRDGLVPPLLVVFVNGLPKQLWSDSKDGSAPVETVLIKELIPHIDQSYRTVTGRAGRIVEGFSMGGYGAARLGFKYPELFAGVSLLAGGPLDLDFQGPRALKNPQQRASVLDQVCSGDMEYFKMLSPWTIAEANAKTIREKKTVIRQAVGDKDFSLALNRKFHEHLEQLGIRHEFIVIPNVRHDADALLGALSKRSVQFYRDALAPAP